MGLRDRDQPQRVPEPAPPLVRLNHVSFSCASVEESVDFYRRALGFELVQRPASLDFKGAW
jgi:catechol-2,3-dioxygenase